MEDSSQQLWERLEQTHGVNVTIWQEKNMYERRRSEEGEKITKNIHKTKMCFLVGGKVDYR